MAPQTEHEDMTVVAISLAGAGAFCSIGNVTSRASSSMDRCPLALHGAQVLARAVAILVMVMHGALFDLIVVAAVVPSDVMDWAETRREGSGEGVSDCSRAVVPVGSVVTGSECEVPPHRPPPLRGGGCSESRRVLSL